VNEFAMPVLPVVGGILIGLSASLLLLLIGKVAGISGILWGAMGSVINKIQTKHGQASDDKVWRWMFLGGLIVGAWLLHFITGIPYPQLAMSSKTVVLAVIAGLFVGVGVKLGNGCTSGHGVCGIGRLSIRSLTATITFMLVAVITVFIMRTLGGLS